MKLIATALALLSLTFAPGFARAQAQDQLVTDTPAPQSAIQNPKSPVAGPILHREVPDDPYMPTPPQPPRGKRGRTRWARGQYVSIQVNVDELGDNIVGDAANEPSIAIDPTDPNKIVIGWRQFDTVESNFRQAGWAYSHDAGQTWTFPGVLEPGVFRSDPVLDVDADGSVYYMSLFVDSDFSSFRAGMFISSDGGITWSGPFGAFGGDKQWIVVDKTGGVGRGNLYQAWNTAGNDFFPNQFNRSTDGGFTWSDPAELPLPRPIFGTLAVDADGNLYISGQQGGDFYVIKSTNAKFAAQSVVFDFIQEVELGGQLVVGAGPNPSGLLGQVWIATDTSDGPTVGNVYMLCSVDPSGGDPLDVMFARSTDGGLTWSEPIRVNDDLVDNGAWQWFGTMSVAPNGRIDVVWNDTRNTGSSNWSELFYAFSMDGGLSWSENVPVSPAFDSWVGWPNQSKIGDYYDAISDNSGMTVAYAATFNDEQDVYYLRILADCNSNGIPDDEDIADGTSEDCNDNHLPDECEPDCNGNGTPDPCEVIDGDSEDCDGDWVPDECEPDFDDDGLIDDCDPDIDDDGVPNEADVCDFTPLGAPVQKNGSQIGDLESDCDVDLRDYSRFDDCISSSGPGTPPSLGYCVELLDFDGDEDIDLWDFLGFSTAFTGSGE